ncbi:coniferyl aldehyde dehydrogenase [Vibrio tapetis subsp. quintayensis]|uniref:coniferyl aldehyde dehydrogenase n=1 Tax=Vibrio tapetis TaxID=52443 RepID=UPI0025B5C4F0|nr:coniferyl aldehyde dehydrogenase [Vibrio tapetis]MDN3680243.1 coniferyl aldehyde dehydrogenase [Vibrio tapetis subsp. quintayensis]
MANQETINQQVLQHEDSQIEALNEHFHSLSAQFKQTPYLPIEKRIETIIEIKQALISGKDTLIQALSDDYGYRSQFDSLLADIMATVQHANYTLKHIKKWVKSERRHTGLLLFPSKVTVHQQPLGVIGVVTPWNFPINLSINPAITALAAGNRVMIKMSEFTPNTNRVLKQMLSNIDEQVVFIEGEMDVSSAFSKLPFDHLFFTGSTEVGKHIARAAADNLTPITLELGGKSPVIIDDHISMNSAIDSIILGKTVNAGQICVAPDYICLPKARQQEFIDTYIKRFQHFYGGKAQSSRHGCIINERQLSRLQSYLTDAEQRGANLHPVSQDSTGNTPSDLMPTLISNVNDDMLIMKNEIFGSLLPIMTYDHIDEAFRYIDNRARPLALYVMTEDKALIERATYQVHSGALSINDTLLHVAAEDAPFGGIGHSGLGSYHGIEGFKTFSHSKTVFHTAAWLPRSALLLKKRDLMTKLLQKVFLR